MDVARDDRINIKPRLGGAVFGQKVPHARTVLSVLERQRHKTARLLPDGSAQQINVHLEIAGLADFDVGADISVDPHNRVVIRYKNRIFAQRLC